MSLYIEYRPVDFDEVEGNETVVSSVASFLARDRKDIPHVWLFTGPSGCGKTTMARIVSEKLGCKGADFCEVDAAGENGIKTVRAIREQMLYSPIEGSCRVWLLDECHMITPQGQEALLKALEDTPPHVYFMLATTEPNKLKTTLKNRCVSFEMQPLGERAMSTFLADIVRCEGKTVSTDVLKIIAQNSMGSSRAALQLLDAVIDLNPEEMKKAAEREAVKQNSVIHLCRALMECKGWSAIARILNDLEEEDPEGVRRSILKYASAILRKGDDNPQAFIVMDCFREPTYNNGWEGIIMAAYEAVEEQRAVLDKKNPF